MHWQNGFKSTAILTLVVGISACSDNNSKASITPENVSIYQGIYGYTTQFDDVSVNNEVNEVEILAKFDIEIFHTIPPTDYINEVVVPIASTESDEAGFYEIELTPGEYCVCTAFRRCVPVAVSSNSPIQLDYEFSNGAGWYLPSDPESIYDRNCAE